ncbi:restriction endonuclease [Candidatus Parcubacteria bacterium]|nr:restriction endonuclease [Candidatus Parcubacteria bacterium]
MQNKVNKIFVINQRGEREMFSFQKVLRSAKRVGASHQVAQEIAQKIEKKAFEGMKTSEIFSLVKSFLNQTEPVASLKFSLRDAMRKLGPTGFPFEKFVGKVLEKNGYKVKLNQIVKGKCIEYEIDCLTEKGGEVYLVECKYRNLASDVVDTQNVAILYAKFLDISQQRKVKPLLITNAKFTTRAIKYAKCVGVDLLGWQYPQSRGLERVIDGKKLYPITILPSLNKNLLFSLNQAGIVLVEELLKANQSHQLNFIPANQLNRIISEAKLLE